MTLRTVLRMGDPRLLKVAEPIVRFDDALVTLVRDLFETMDALSGAGLAAPQIGVSQRVVVFEVNGNPRYPEAEPVPRTVLVNPEITFLTEETGEGWEGCLSVPGLRGRVPRCTRIRYRGFDAEGQGIDRVAAGFHARVVQHECDHLDGILYPMRIRDFSYFGFERELFPAP